MVCKFDNRTSKTLVPVDHFCKSERKAMVGEAKSYHKNPETSYLEEGFSGIQNAAMVLISSDQINEVWRFPKM